MNGWKIYPRCVFLQRFGATLRLLTLNVYYSNHTDPHGWREIGVEIGLYNVSVDIALEWWKERE